MAVQYLVIVEKGATSFGAYAPDLAGCAVAGGTCEAVLALVKSANDGFEAIGLCGHFFKNSNGSAGVCCKLIGVRSSGNVYCGSGLLAICAL